ncbi:hypothetical protein EV702DRAFT_1050344 [Suillus placidus]|uniref:Uncharacterized protein n=1 Tax=Suillus placidus TaxID=48579 RepID=A0A9P6ZIJ5_9AGAM|nr:hypothetical protein EV702DRAFT_1050344 [Suillus placidus]
MNHWVQSGWPAGYPGPHGDSESSNQLQPPRPSLPWGLPASSNGSNLNFQSQSPFLGDINIQPTVTPGLRLVSEISPAHNATTGYSIQRLGYPGPHWQDGVGGSSRPGFDSQFQVENGFQPASASQAADAATYNNSNNDSHSQDPTDGNQRHPLVSDIPVSDTASYSFQLSHSQESAAGGSQHQPPASGIPGSSLQEPAGGGPYQPPSSVTPAPNSASYHDFNPYLQEHAGGSNPSLQSGVQFPTGGWLHQAVSRSLHHSSSDVGQNVLQASAPSQTFLNSASFEPVQTQGARIQLSLSGLGAHGPNNQDHRPTDPKPESMFDRLGQTRDVKQRVTHASPYKTPVTSIPPQSSRPDPILQIPSLLIDSVKNDASTRMNTTIFNQSLFPSTEKTEEWAKSALDSVAAVHVDNKEELAAWRLRKEGQTALSQLKGTIKRLHANSREYAEGFVAGGYGLSLDTSQTATNILTLRKDYTTSLVSNNNFLDKFVQQFRRHVAFNSPGWESRLMNVIALAGTICRWIFKLSYHSMHRTSEHRYFLLYHENHEEKINNNAACKSTSGIWEKVNSVVCTTYQYRYEKTGKYATAALHIDAIVEHKGACDACTTIALDDRGNRSVTAYKLEVASFAIIDREHGHVESLTCVALRYARKQCPLQAAPLLDSDASAMSLDEDNFGGIFGVKFPLACSPSHNTLGESELKIKIEHRTVNIWASSLESSMVSGARTCIGGWTFLGVFIGCDVLDRNGFSHYPRYGWKHHRRKRRKENDNTNVGHANGGEVRRRIRQVRPRTRAQSVPKPCHIPPLAPTIVDLPEEYLRNVLTDQIAPKELTTEPKPTAALDLDSLIPLDPLPKFPPPYTDFQSCAD